MRVFLLVIDSFGLGALPDAADYGDEGAHTALGISRSLPGGLRWPYLQAMGLGNAAMLTGEALLGCPPVSPISSSFAAMRERSVGKDTTTGHWELAGLVLEKPFPIFPSSFPSFPADLIHDFIEENKLPGILGNKAASGTHIIEELGAEHLSSGKPICYTSADSVFQIACHEEIFNQEELEKICKVARELCNPYAIARVISRPFTGKPGHFIRTKNRHDWSIALPGKTLFDYLQERDVETVAVGKIAAIFNNQGIDRRYPDAGNQACLERSLSLAKERKKGQGFVFVNLVDTDMIYGHRRDPRGYHDAVAQIDAVLPQLEASLEQDDLMIIVGDHGCDPTFKGNDHTREYVPMLMKIITKNRAPRGKNLGIRESFADLSASIQEAFGQEVRGEGKSFWRELSP